MTVEKGRNHSVAFSFPMTPKQMVFIWGPLFLCLSSMTKMPLGTTGMLGHQHGHVSSDHFDSCDDEMRVQERPQKWEWKRPDWTIPFQPLHPSWQERVPRQKMYRPAWAKYPGRLETLTIWQEFEWEPWDTLWAEEEAWILVLLGCFTSALVLVYCWVTLCEIQENTLCPFSRPVTAPLFGVQLLLSHKPSDARPHRNGSGFPCEQQEFKSLCFLLGSGNQGLVLQRARKPEASRTKVLRHWGSPVGVETLTHPSTN